METETEPCAICGDEMCLETTSNSKITLRCKHSYHYLCLIETLKYKMQISKGKLRPLDRCCPYCRQRIPLIHYKSTYNEFIEGVHIGPGPVTAFSPGPAIGSAPAGFSSQASLLAPGFLSNGQPSAPKCSGICKTGLPCNFKGKFNGFCGHHKPNTI